MNFLRTILLAAVCCLPLTAEAAKLDDIATTVACQETPPADWERGFSLGYPAAKVSEPVKLKGKVETVTAIISTDENDRERVVAGAVFVDVDEQGNSEHKQARKIWHWLVNNVGSPYTVEWGWVWEVPPTVSDKVERVDLVLYPDGAAIVLVCR